NSKWKSFLSRSFIACRCALGRDMLLCPLTISVIYFCVFQIENVEIRFGYRIEAKDKVVLALSRTCFSTGLPHFRTLGICVYFILAIVTATTGLSSLIIFCIAGT